MRNLTVILLASLILVAFGQSGDSYGDWVLFVRIDPFTDEDKSAIVTPAQNQALTEDAAMIIIQCGAEIAPSSGGVFLAFGINAAKDLEKEVVYEYRVDQEAPVTLVNSFVRAPTLVLPDVFDIGGILDDFSIGKEVVFRLAEEPNRHYYFSLLGMVDALQHLDCYHGHLKK